MRLAGNASWNARRSSLMRDGSAGEIEHGDLRRRHAGLRHGRQRRAHDALQERTDGAGEVRFRNGGAQALLDEAEIDGGVAAFGDRDLGALDVRRDAMAVPSPEDRHQPGVQARVLHEVLQLVRARKLPEGVQEIDLVPGRKLEEQGRGHRPAVLARRFVAQLAHDGREAQALIEIAAREMDAGAGEEIAGPNAAARAGTDRGARGKSRRCRRRCPRPAPLPRSRATVSKSNAAAIGSYSKLTSSKPASRAISARVASASRSRSGSSSTKCTGRPMHQPLQPARGVRLGHVLQVRQEFGDDVAIGHVAPVDERRLGQEIAAEEALQRAHEAAFRALLVLLQRLPPEDGHLLLCVVEDGRRNGLAAVLERHQERAALRGQADRGVRRSEVDCRNAGFLARSLRHARRRYSLLVTRSSTFPWACAALAPSCLPPSALPPWACSQPPLLPSAPR